MTRSVNGKTAIVTGAGSGINLEFARILLRNGANVILADLALRPEAQQLVDEYQKSPRAIFQKTNATSWADLNNMFKVAMEQFGQVDIVCPGAGVFEPPVSSFWFPPGTGPSKDPPEGDRFMSIDLNLVHPIRTTQLAISHFLSSSSNSGSSDLKTVVLIASVAAELAFIAVPLYHATKWGLRGFIYSLADLEPNCGIRVAGVAPAIVRTPLWLDHEDKRKAVVVDGKEQDDWVTPEEVAETMFAIATEDEVTAKTSGEKVPIKGGSLIEVVADNVSDVPMFGNGPPGSSGGHGLMATNIGELIDTACSEVKKPGWGMQT